MYVHVPQPWYQEFPRAIHYLCRCGYLGNFGRRYTYDLVAVDDAFFMRGLQAFAALSGEGEEFFSGNRSFQAMAQGFAFDVLHYQPEFASMLDHVEHGERPLAALFGTYSIGLAGYAAVLAQIVLTALVTAATSRHTVLGR